MQEVRKEIDKLDQKIVELISIRQGYIEQAGHIKADRQAVRDPERVEDVVHKAKQHAQKVGASPELVETIYRPMIEWCINYEFTVYDDKEAK
ncbi:MAG: chorismate mutase [Kordiimonas sp.]|nr:chorismate mutase [Kordiimonas sp.]